MGAIGYCVKIVETSCDAYSECDVYHHTQIDHGHQSYLVDIFCVRTTDSSVNKSYVFLCPNNEYDVEVVAFTESELLNWS